MAFLDFALWRAVRNCLQALVSQLEMRSRYENWKGNRPTVHRFHKLHVEGRNYFVLTKIAYAGADYSHRANHLLIT